MAIDDLPGPLVNFLNVIGIEWPYINEDSISQFASVVREFGQAVERTHQDATDAVQKLAQAHQGASTRQMASGWAELSTAHVNEIVQGAGIVADALDAWAAYIVVQKGIAEAALPAIIAAGQAAGKSLIQDLEQYVIGQVMEAALKPFMAKVQQLLSGLDWGSTSAAGSGAGEGFRLDEAAARQQISVLRTHADTMIGHGQTLRNGIAGLS